MTHEEFLDLIPEMIGERLADSVKGAAEAHEAQCAECAGTLRALVILHHPSSDAMVSYALPGGGISAGARRRIEDHLDHCGECRGDVDAIRQANRSADAGVGGGSRSGRFALAAAAGIAAVLVYPAWLGLVRLPSVERSVEDLKRIEADLREEAGAGKSVRPGFAPAGGIARMTLLRSGTRSEEDLPVVRSDVAAEVIPLGVEIMLPPGAADGERLTFELRARAGEDQPAWRAELPVEDGRSALRRDGMILLLVPAARLRDNPEAILAVYLEGEARREVARLAFKVEVAP